MITETTLFDIWFNKNIGFVVMISYLVTLYFYMNAKLNLKGASFHPDEETYPEVITIITSCVLAAISILWSIGLSLAVIGRTLQ